MTGDPRYIIGIDLGTTNSAVAYIDRAAAPGSRNPRLFKIPQLTAPGEIAALDLLPSFLYLRGEHELRQEALALPWSSDDRMIAGAFARDQGVRIPKRMVASAKSWLCHERVNRKDRILPWGADEAVEKISPVAAAAACLGHIRAAWNHAYGHEEELLLENQQVVLTVPASFDEAARDLTVEAARQAGLAQVTLLEEPLAAFYHWLSQNEQNWDRSIHPGELILVCDVGGGTSDFTLITLREKVGGLVFDRIAVGDHLILGGDNMDLALARRLETRLRNDRKGALSVSLWQSLCQQCRNAKEKILGGRSDSETITLVGESRRVIADTVSTPLTREEIEATVVDGFFPPIEPEDPLSEPPRIGITEFGLPYAADPAVTRHLIRFLNRHRADVAELLARDSVFPDLILFNGGALKPEVVQERIRAAIRRCFRETDASRPRVLVNSELDLAVALGAGYYGRVRSGEGVRVGSGSPRAYYLGVGSAAGDDAEPSAVCLVERGMQEGSRSALEDKRFEVMTNQPVSFDLYSSSFRMGDRIGDVIRVDDSVTPLPPIHTVIQFGRRGKKAALPVAVEAHYTELGTLALWCRSGRTQHRWRLQFQLRETPRDATLSDREVFEESAVQAAIAEIDAVYAGPAGRAAPEQLINAIADAIKSSKERWPLGFLRRLADRLLDLEAERRRSAGHESRWLNLTGFCLRPGFGEVLDAHRIERLWRVRHAGALHPRDAQVRSEWWILCRRVSGGLDSKQQRQILNEISPLLKHRKKSEKKRLAPQEHTELWMLLASLERLPAHEKTVWGAALLDMLGPKRSRPQFWWALSRIGAREPLYGPIERTVPSKTAAAWVDAVLSRQWRNPKPVAAALSQMARLTGDRRRDLDFALRQRLIRWLEGFAGFETYRQALLEVKPILSQEESDIFGESLPTGIVLHL